MCFCFFVSKTTIHKQSSYYNAADLDLDHLFITGICNYLVIVEVTRIFVSM